MVRVLALVLLVVVVVESQGCGCRMNATRRAARGLPFASGSQLRILGRSQIGSTSRYDWGLSPEESSM